MASRTVDLEFLGGGVTVLRFNRPKVKNAFNADAFLEVARTVSALANDSRCVCLIVTGSGDYFSSGADLSSFSMAPSQRLDEGPSAKFMRAFLNFPKPVIAAVNGPAVGVAVTLLPHCDIVYAAQSATFWTPFARLALCPEFASSVLFEEVLGRSMASEMLMGQRKLTANEALAFNLVSRVLPDNGFLDQVVALAKEMTSVHAADKTLPLYKAMSSAKRRKELDKVITEEFNILEQRGQSGIILEAMTHFMQSKGKTKSKL